MKTKKLPRKVTTKNPPCFWATSPDGWVRLIGLGTPKV